MRKKYHLVAYQKKHLNKFYWFEFWIEIFTLNKKYLKFEV